MTNPTLKIKKTSSWEVPIIFMGLRLNFLIQHDSLIKNPFFRGKNCGP